MKKVFLVTILIGLALTVGFVWVDSNLSSAGDDCLCKNYADMQYKCQQLCSAIGSSCWYYDPEPVGVCFSTTCRTQVSYVCQNGSGGVFTSFGAQCIDCY